MSSEIYILGGARTPMGEYTGKLKDFSALELGGSWRTLETVLVLGAWAVAGAVVTPRVLRRMSRRSTGSQVQAAREAAVQWVR